MRKKIVCYIAQIFTLTARRYATCTCKGKFFEPELPEELRMKE